MKLMEANFRQTIAMVAGYLRLNFVNNMTYRLDFIAGFLIDLVSSLMLLWFYHAVFSQIGTMEGWNIEAVMILCGNFIFVNSLYVGFFFHGISKLPGLVVEGKLDDFLLRPASTRLQIAISEIDYSCLVGATFGISIVCYYALSLNLEVSFSMLAAYIFANMSGLFFLYNSLWILMTFSFWLGRIEELRDFLALVIDFGNRPANIYPKPLKNLFLWVLPLLLLANIPTDILLNRQDINIYLLGIVANMPMFFLSHYLWKKGLKSYASANK